MFGFSFAELILVFLVAIFFIKPQDLPEIAHFLGKIYYKARKLLTDIKLQLKSVEKDLGLDELKDEINRGIAEEKMKIEDAKKEVTQIIDMYGNYHEVNVGDVRSDLSDEDLKSEIAKYNDLNSSSSQQKQDLAPKP